MIDAQVPYFPQVTLEFNFLPPPPDGGLYRCVFNNEFVPATFVSPKSLKCALPSPPNRPRVPDDEGNLINDSQQSFSGLRILFFRSCCRFVENLVQRQQRGFPRN